MKCIIFLCLLATSDGFLLTGTNSSQGNTGFLTISEYLGDKTQGEHALNQVKQDLLTYHNQQERNFNLLTTELQLKLNEIDKKLAEKTNIADLEQKYEEISKKYEEMKTSSETWQQKYAELENEYNQTTIQLMQELTTVKTDNLYLKTQIGEVHEKVDGLNQLKSLNELQIIHQLDLKSKEFENRMNSLETTQQARSQDFVALYGKVTSLESTEQILESNMQGNLSFLEQNVQSNFTSMQQNLNAVVHGLEQKTSAEMKAVRATNNQSLSLLRQQMVAQFQPVIFRASNLNNGNVPAGVLKFPKIDFTAGVPNSTITTYQSTGKFTCHEPGYFYMIATVESPSANAYVDIMVNSDSKLFQDMTGTTYGKWTPGTTAIILNLQLNDKLWIKTKEAFSLYRSSLNIFKIK